MKYVLNLDLVSSHHIIVPNTNLDTNMVTAIGWRLYYDDSATKMLTKLVKLTNVIHGRAVHTGERSTYGEYYKIMAYSNTKEYINIKN